MMMATITPNSPRALPKISTTRIFTNRVEFCASDSAQQLPTIPTQMLRMAKAMKATWMQRYCVSKRACTDQIFPNANLSVTL